jgi:hypothetical protein
MVDIDDVTISEIDTVWPFLTGVHALIVMDGSPSETHYGSFGPGDPSTDPNYGDRWFGLSEFIRSLHHSKFTTFIITKAHRDTDVGGHADIEHFRFDGAGVDLSVYDEIFLFGLAPDYESLSPMSESEISALAEFMDGGGGVFATGDHEDLGVALCGRVPRVRSMRKWFYTDPGPHGEPQAPPAIGTDRIETTQRPSGAGVTNFDDQSDDIPQPIQPKMYVWRAGFFSSQLYPHPLLCGPKGPIRVLPDHMHEGEVIVPWDPTASLTYDGHTFTEYPTDSGGHRELPEIVGWGKVVAETDVSTEYAHTGDPTNVAIARDFGVIGAYDGHRVGVGRVAVDSTWHHFFDINLIGDPIAPFPKTEGFNASTDGKAVLADIEAYYVNIGTWIARPGAHLGLFAGAAWRALLTQPLAMLVHPSRDYSTADLIGIGGLGLDGFIRVAPPCTLTYLTHRVLVEGPVRVWPSGDPWQPPGNGDPGMVVDPILVEKLAFGSAIVNVARQRREIGRLQGREAAAALREAAVNGAHDGVRTLGRELGRYAERLEAFSNEIRGQGHAEAKAD